MKPPGDGWLENWRSRHRSRLSFWLHMTGIPLTVAAVGLCCAQLLLGRWESWWGPPLLFVAGYLAQFLGHLHEGNDMGEIILVKRLLGKPYVAVSPRYQQR
ncbi:MAG: Mpo1-like protein [Planctomycetota bacterium]